MKNKNKTLARQIAFQDMIEEDLSIKVLNEKSKILAFSKIEPTIILTCQTNCLSKSSENCSNCSIFF